MTTPTPETAPEVLPGDRLPKVVAVELEKVLDGGGALPDGFIRDVARECVAAVLPAHEAMVRAKVAKEIEAYADAAAKTGPMIPLAARKGILLAARITRGARP